MNVLGDDVWQQSWVTHSLAFTEFALCATYREKTPTGNQWRMRKRGRQILKPILNFLFCSHWSILLSSWGAGSPCGLPEPGGFERVFLGLGPGSQQGLPRLQKQARQHLPSQPQTRWDLRCTRQVFRWDSFTSNPTTIMMQFLSGLYHTLPLTYMFICFHEFTPPFQWSWTWMRASWATW